MVAVNVTSHGYDGPLNEVQLSLWATVATKSPSFVGTGWKPSLGSTAGTVTLAPGLAGGFGIGDLLNASPTIQHDPLTASGFRYDVVVLQRDKQPVNGGVTSVQIIKGSMGGARSNPGPSESGVGVSQTPIYLARYEGTTSSAQITELVDLRVRQTEVFQVADWLALSGSWRDGTVATLDSGGATARAGGQWLDPPQLKGFSPLIPATWTIGDGFNLGVTTALAMHAPVTVPVPPGVRALVRTEAWALVEPAGGGVVRLTPRGVWTDFNGVHDFASNKVGWVDPAAYGGEARLHAWEERVVTGPVTYQPTVQIYGAKAHIFTGSGTYNASSWKWEAI